MSGWPKGPFRADAIQRESRIIEDKISKRITYGGGKGRRSWLQHRITEIGVFVFLPAHIVDTAKIGWGTKGDSETLAIDRRPQFRAGEVMLAGGALYHALKGVGVMIRDGVSAHPCAVHHGCGMVANAC